MNDPKSTQEFRAAAHDGETSYASGGEHLASDAGVPIPEQEGFGFSDCPPFLAIGGSPREERDGGGTGALNWDPDSPPDFSEQAPTEAEILAARPICDSSGCGGEIPVGGEGHPEICPACLELPASNGIPYAVGTEGDGEPPPHSWTAADALSIHNRTTVQFLLECAGGEAGFVVNPMHLGHKIFAMVGAGLAELTSRGGEFHLVKSPSADSRLALEDDKYSGVAWRENTPAESDPNHADKDSLHALLCDEIAAINAIDEAVTMGTARIGNQIEEFRGVLEDMATSFRQIADFAAYLRTKIGKEEAGS